jgi:hypothetical protein
MTTTLAGLKVVETGAQVNTDNAKHQSFLEGVFLARNAIRSKVELIYSRRH